MARVFITGSAKGLGRATAQALLEQGHEVIVHARRPQRLTAVQDLVDRGAASVVGDLSDTSQVRALAAQVNQLGRPDAVIHNAGVYTGPAVLPVNIVAPYLLTALIPGPSRLIYLSSSEHFSGRARVGGVDWTGAGRSSYADSKLFVTALSAVVARRCASVASNAVDPGWVPTKMGGPNAPDSLALGSLTQQWLAVSDDPGTRRSGGYWHHQHRREPHPAVRDPAFQGELMNALAVHTGIRL